MSIQAKIEQLIEYWLECERLEIERRRPYHHKLILELNRIVQETDYSDHTVADFMILLKYAKEANATVRAVANSYIASIYGPDFMTFLLVLANTTDDNAKIKKVIEKIPMETMAKIGGYYKTSKVFMKFVREQFMTVTGRDPLMLMTTAVAENSTILKKLPAQHKNTEVRIDIKVKFIKQIFNKEIPEYISFIFIDKIKNHELDMFILKCRKAEIASKKWQGPTAEKNDDILKKWIGEGYFNNYNSFHDSISIKVS